MVKDYFNDNIAIFASIMIQYYLDDYFLLIVNFAIRYLITDTKKIDLVLFIC